MNIYGSLQGTSQLITKYSILLLFSKTNSIQFLYNILWISTNKIANFTRWCRFIENHVKKQEKY